MPNTGTRHPEMPVLTIGSDGELQIAMLRIRALEAASPDEACEALQQAVASYRNRIDGAEAVTEG